MSLPRTSDGKPIYATDMFPIGYYLYVTGAGDDSSVGDGPEFYVESEAEGNSYVEWYYQDQYRLAGGDFVWENGVLGDWVSYEVIAEATSVTLNESNTGNCVLVDSPLGEDTLIVPVANNGTHDVDLEDCVPVPSSEHTGYWQWSNAPIGIGDVSTTSGNGDYHLLTVGVTLSRFVNKLVMLGSGKRDIDVSNISPKVVLPHWKHKVTIHNSGHTGLKATWSFYGARARTR
jgi:hypothetical protein